MSDAALAALAESAGVMVRWHDVHGREHRVAPPTLRAVLAAIGLPADSDAAVAQSRRQLAATARHLPRLLTLDAGVDHPLGRSWRAELESGEHLEGKDTLSIPVPGYHRLEVDGDSIAVAVAPPRCPAPPRGWGLAAQLYGLRRHGDGGIGDFAALADLVRAAAARGAACVAASPVHALFAADASRISPYAPSSRIMLNVLHANTSGGDAAAEGAALIDWRTAGPARLARLRAAFRRGEDRDALAAFRAERGEALEAHARFEALHAHFLARDPALWHWQDWPDAFRAPSRPAVAAFAEQQAEEVGFYAWLQYRADRDLAAVQRAGREAGMAIGLIADLAVGADAGGSHAWSRQDEMLPGLTIGAPPDLFNPRGQDWGVATFSPRALAGHGYGAFIELLRATLRHAGGMRIDHAMGLERLWVVPAGAAPAEGAYLRYPCDDLLRLVRLESWRHGAVVVAEDLGTVPEGFPARLAAAGVLGMRVLWFERDGTAFRAPAAWTRDAAAMTSTHDLPTVAGWWLGRDIDWRERLHLIDDAEAARRQRAQDRAAMWQAIGAGGAAGDAPAPGAVADAACRHVAASAATLALLPLEDVLGLVEQPNLPGTFDEHPNWRRRYPATAATLLDAAPVAAGLAAVAAQR